MPDGSFFDPRPMIIDCFAGGGGASTGIELALGRSPDVAINHSASALALHAANHPETLHIPDDIWNVDPRAIVRGRRVGLLWASPDCKHFSKAKGGAPLDRNIRDLAWTIVRYAEEVQPDVICMENVEEFQTWGPVDDDGKPIKWLAGHTFHAWIKRLKKAGYKVQHRELRACDFGAPTIRKRWFLIARRDGLPITWPTPTHGDPRSAAVKKGKRLPWRTAAECIDWDLPCPSIFDTKAEIKAKHGLNAVRPLANNTLARVARGMKRYVLEADEPFLVNLRPGKAMASMRHALGQEVDDDHSSYDERQSYHAPHVDLLAKQDKSGQRDEDYPGARPDGVGDANRDVLEGQRQKEKGHSVSQHDQKRRPKAAEAFRGLECGRPDHFGGHGDYQHDIGQGTAPDVLIAHSGSPDGRPAHADVSLSSPLLATMRNSQKPWQGADEPTHTITACGAGLSLIAPNLMSLKGSDRRDSAATAPHPTVLAGGGHSAILAPVLTYAQQGGGNRDMRDPHHTICASRKDQNSLMAAAMVHVGNGERAGQAPRALDVRAPLNTVVAGGVKQYPVTAFLAQQNGGPRMDGHAGHDLRQPISTVTGSGSQQTPVAAFFAKYYGTGDGARSDDPCHTITVKDRMAHMQAELSAPPFTPAHEARAREVAKFLRAHDAWTDDEFVTLTIEGQTFIVVDIGMRMLTPRELFRAQGFPADYIIDGVWEGLDDPETATFRAFPKDVQVNCCGNSVCPPLAEAIIRANCGHLAELEVAA